MNRWLRILPIGAQARWLARGLVDAPPPFARDLRDARCAPLSGSGALKAVRSGGLFDRDGRAVPAAGLRRYGRDVLLPGPAPAASACERLDGRSLYLGPVVNHCGHFLTETLARLWPYTRQALEAYDHVLIQPWGATLPRLAAQAFDALGLGARLRIVERPLCLASVDAPAQAIALDDRVHAAVGMLHRLFAPTRRQRRRTRRRCSCRGPASASTVRRGR